MRLISVVAAAIFIAASATPNVVADASAPPELIEAMAEMTQRVNALTQSTERLQARVSAHEDETTTLTKYTKRLESQVDELEEESTALKGRLAAVAKEHDTQTSALRQGVAALKRALDAAGAQPGALGYSCMCMQAASHA